MSGERSAASPTPDIELARLATHVQRRPNDPDLMETFGRACLKAGKADIGLTALMRAARLEPVDLARLSRVARLFLDLGQIVKSIELLRFFVAIRPEEPAGWYELGQLLMRSGAVERARDAFSQAEPLAGGARLALTGLAQVHLALADLEGAVCIADRLLTIDRRNAMAYFIRGAAHLRSGRIDQGVADMQRCLLLAPDHVEAHHNLVTPLLAAGRVMEARLHGRRALELKDMDACVLPRLFVPTPPLSTGKKVVSFSLWGENPTYLNGAVDNAAAVRRLYPGWEAWFYVDTTVASDVCEALTLAGARVVPMVRRTPVEGLFWRFLPASHPDVARLIARDCDSLPSPREVAAVAAWERSGKAMHVMRDNIAHCELVLAGMWGVRGGVIPDIAALFGSYTGTGRPRWSDQDFLAERIWPLLKNDALIHDSFYPLFGAEPYPEVEDTHIPGGHIGAKL